MDEFIISQKEENVKRKNKTEISDLRAFFVDLKKRLKKIKIFFKNPLTNRTNCDIIIVRHKERANKNKKRGKKK